jgi:hypothetical protein
MTDPNFLTELVYEAAFVPDLWNRGLDELARSIGEQGTVLAARLCAGEDVAAIADALTLSTDTIRSHVRAILGKSGMSASVSVVIKPVRLQRCVCEDAGSGTFIGSQHDARAVDQERNCNA